MMDLLHQLEIRRDSGAGVEVELDHGSFFR
jgi:hypothetical protein